MPRSIIRAKKKRSPNIRYVSGSYRLAPDGLGNQPAYTNAERRVYTITYDALGRLLTATHALGQQVFLNSYDPVGNLTNRLDGTGNATAYTYDPLNRLVAFHTPNSRLGIEMKATNTEIIRLLGEIVQDTPLSQTVASNLETTILEAYPEADNDERFENVLHMLASFESHGREYMYDEEQLRQECKLLLAKLSG